MREKHWQRATNAISNINNTRSQGCGEILQSMLASQKQGFYQVGTYRIQEYPNLGSILQGTFDITGPLPGTKFGNKYVLVAIDHYSKCYKVKVIVDHDI